MAFKNNKTAPSEAQSRQQPKSFSPFSSSGQKRTAHIQIPEEEPSQYPEVRALQKQQKRNSLIAAVAGGTIGLTLGQGGMFFGAIAGKQASEKSAKKKEAELTAEIENRFDTPVVQEVLAV